MALVGGGGSPNVGGGSNPAGTGSSLNYIGNHAYAYSGEVIVNNNTVTMLEFTTGSEYVMAKFSYGVDRNAVLGGSKQIGFTISMDNQKIMQVVTYTNSTHGILDFDNNYSILLPPFTKVKIESETDEADNIPTFAMLTGRVYA